MTNNHLRVTLLLTASLLFVCLQPFEVRAAADKPNFQLGFKAGTMLGDGEPANDMIMAGLYGRYQLDTQWLIGFALDYSEFDFEAPNRIFGLVGSSVEVIDATTEAWYFTSWAEKQFDLENKRIKPFILAELGVGFLDAEDVIIPLQGGGAADITTDAGTEFLIGVG